MKHALSWTTRLLTHGKPALPWIAVSILAISTRSNHDYTIGANFMMFLQSVYHLVTSSCTVIQTRYNCSHPLCSTSTWHKQNSPTDVRNVLWNGVDNLTYRANTSTFIADTFILIPAINVSTRHAELASIAHWAQANNLTLNIAKSQEILFSDKRRKWKILCTHWNSRTQAGANYQNPWRHCY